MLQFRPSRSSTGGFVIPLAGSADCNDGNEVLNLRNQLARARNTILTLRQRVNEADKEKREHSAKLRKLSAFERDPPTYEEFCQFLADSAAKPGNSASAEEHRSSPTHSESSISVQGSRECPGRAQEPRLVSDLEKAGRSPLSLSSRDVSMDCECAAGP